MLNNVLEPCLVLLTIYCPVLLWLLISFLANEGTKILGDVDEGKCRFLTLICKITCDILYLSRYLCIFVEKSPDN